MREDTTYVDPATGRATPEGAAIAERLIDRTVHAGFTALDAFAQGNPAGADIAAVRAIACRLIAAAAEHGRRLGLAQALGERACRVCGCTEHHACLTEDGPCAWAADPTGGDLCTACAPLAAAPAHFQEETTHADR